MFILRYINVVILHLFLFFNHITLPSFGTNMKTPIIYLYPTSFPAACFPLFLESFVKRAFEFPVRFQWPASSLACSSCLYFESNPGA
ncbi:hypothetical protein BSG1_15048 [Bacillus sp. SG-1]|nr:hypothetical protein BSG1_15048 [Bacillus sp. SG-1]